MPLGPIIVVGGGPAGATVALLLSRAGERVDLLERRSDEIGKCCGGCLAPRAIPILRRLGLESLVRGSASDSTREWRLLDPHGRVILHESLGATNGLVVERAVLDASLRAEAVAAGARLRRGVSIERVIQERPAIVIGADGVGGGVARRFGLAPCSAGASEASRVAGNSRVFGGSGAEGRWPRAGGVPLRARRSLGAAWTIDGAQAKALGVSRGVISIHLARGGYIGVVRAGERALVASFHDRSDPGAESRPLQAIRRWRDESESLAALDLDDAPMLATGPLPWRPASVARPRSADLPAVALCGDAAGYEEPFTGEGMTWAFESAELLVRRILATTEWNERAAREYTEAHRQRFELRRMRLRAMAGIGRAVARRPMLAALLRVAGAVPALPGSIVRRVVAA